MNILVHVRHRPIGRLDRATLDYFLWGYVKAEVYIDKPASIDALEDNMEAFTRVITGRNVRKSMPKLD